MLVKRAEQAMVRTKSAALKAVGLTPSQYVALFELDRQPGITAATLARACLVTPQAMMILLKTMEQQGLITRSSHPRHPSVLELHMTEVGREALHAARERVDPIERRDHDYFASWISAVAIFPCAGSRDEVSELALADAFEKGGWQKVTRLYRDQEIPDERCWVRGPGWCLAYD